jgi:hypothetical protein
VSLIGREAGDHRGGFDLGRQGIDYDNHQQVTPAALGVTSPHPHS